MREILEKLKKGDTEIVEYFVKAEKIWSELLVFIDNLSVEELAEKLSDAQIIEFERNCGGNPLGKTIMACSGFAHLYSCQIGFEDNGPRAYKLAQAFKKSTCSMEVKFAAERATEEYGVNDYA